MSRHRGVRHLQDEYDDDYDDGYDDYDDGYDEYDHDQSGYVYQRDEPKKNTPVPVVPSVRTPAKAPATATPVADKETEDLLMTSGLEYIKGVVGGSFKDAAIRDSLGRFNFDAEAALAWLLESGGSWTATPTPVAFSPAPKVQPKVVTQLQHQHPPHSPRLQTPATPKSDSPLDPGPSVFIPSVLSVEGQNTQAQSVNLSGNSASVSPFGVSGAIPTQQTTTPLRHLSSFSPSLPGVVSPTPIPSFSQSPSLGNTSSLLSSASNPPPLSSLSNPPPLSSLSNPPLLSSLSKPPPVLTPLSNPPALSSLSNPSPIPTLPAPPPLSSLSNPPILSALSTAPPLSALSNPATPSLTLPPLSSLSQPPPLSSFTPSSTPMNPLLLPLTPSLSTAPHLSSLSNPPPLSSLLSSGPSLPTQPLPSTPPLFSSLSVASTSLPTTRPHPQPSPTTTPTPTHPTTTTIPKPSSGFVLGSKIGAALGGLMGKPSKLACCLCDDRIPVRVNSRLVEKTLGSATWVQVLWGSVYAGNSEIPIFAFDTPSPDDIVRQKQEEGLGARKPMRGGMGGRGGGRKV